MISDELLDVIIASKKKSLYIDIGTRTNNPNFTVNLPANIIHHLQIYGSANAILDINNLPCSIKSLIISGCNVQSLDFLPISLERLKIEINSFNPLNFSLDNLPVNLKNLFIRHPGFQGSLENLPDSIENLFIDFSLFNPRKLLSADVLKKITIPKNVISLSINICNEFQINLEKLAATLRLPDELAMPATLRLPETLEYLEINCNPKYLEDITFPKKLKYLAINNEVTLNYDNLPKSLEKLMYFDRFDDFSGYVLNTYQLFTGHEEKIICQNIDMKDTFQKINIKNYSFDIYVYNSNAEDNN
jgi:hypothetical protein